MNDEQQVLDVEREWIDAEIRGDAAVLERVLDDRFLLNSMKDKPANKAETVKGILGMKMTAQTLSDQTVPVDGDTAVILGTATLRFADGPTTTYRYTTAYGRRDGHWRALALHMTPLS